MFGAHTWKNNVFLILDNPVFTQIANTVGLLKSLKKGKNKKVKCFLSSKTRWSWQNKRACTSFWTCSSSPGYWSHTREPPFKPRCCLNFQSMRTQAESTDITQNMFGQIKMKLPWYISRHTLISRIRDGKLRMISGHSVVVRAGVHQLKSLQTVD
jgi:hypothetical protein